MHRTQHRVLLTMTAGIAALALGAAPALAGSDGCSGDCSAENAPPAVVPVAPLPVTPQPLRAGQSRRVHRARGVTIAQRTTVPRGAVAAGAGGTAPAGPDGVLALLGGGAVVLLATGGGLVAAGRRSAS
jgi:hypothetical protein